MKEAALCVPLLFGNKICKNYLDKIGLLLIVRRVRIKIKHIPCSIGSLYYYFVSQGSPIHFDFSNVKWKFVNISNILCFPVVRLTLKYSRLHQNVSPLLLNFCIAYVSDFYRHERLWDSIQMLWL